MSFSRFERFTTEEWWSGIRHFIMVDDAEFALIQTTLVAYPEVEIRKDMEEAGKFIKTMGTPGFSVHGSMYDHGGDDYGMCFLNKEEKHCMVLFCPTKNSSMMLKLAHDDLITMTIPLDPTDPRCQAI